MEKRGPPEYAPPGGSPHTMYQPISPAPGVVPPTTTNPPPPTYGPVPVITVCPSCHSHITSRVVPESSTKTHIIAVLLCGLCCCCIPYLVDSCKHKNHYCPSCGSFLGAYKN